MAPSKLPWFCFYVEDFGARWVRRLTPAERWVWAAIQGAARQSPVPGVALLTETEPMTIEDIADFAALKEREVKVALEKLDQLDQVYQRTDGAYVVANWERQLDAEEQSARRAAAGALGNHKRWHVGRGITDPDCRFCAPERPPPEPPGDRSASRNAIAPRSQNGSHDESEGDSPGDRIAIAKQKQEQEEVLLVFQQQQTAVDREPPGHAAAGVLNPLVVGQVAAALMRSRGRFEESLTKTNPPGWLRRTWDGIRGEVVAALPALAAAHPDWTHEQLAAAIDGKPIPAHAGGVKRPVSCDRCAEHPGIVEVLDRPGTFDVCDHGPLRESA